MELDAGDLKQIIADAVADAIKPQLSKTMVAEVVREELENHAGFCRIDLSDAKAAEVGHAFGVFTDLGAGDVSKGIEAIRANHQWTSSMRGLSGKVGGVVLVVAITTLAGGLLAALWAGFKAAIGK